MSNQFWMKLAYWLGLKVTIKCDGIKVRGYVLTPCNQCGDFLINTFPQDWRGNLLMKGRAMDVNGVSLFADWRFKFREYAHRLWLDRMIKKRFNFLGEAHDDYVRKILTLSFVKDCLKLIHGKRFRIGKF